MVGSVGRRGVGRCGHGNGPADTGRKAGQHGRPISATTSASGEAPQGKNRNPLTGANLWRRDPFLGEALRGKKKPRRPGRRALPPRNNLHCLSRGFQSNKFHTLRWCPGSPTFKRLSKQKIQNPRPEGPTAGRGRNFAFRAGSAATASKGEIPASHLRAAHAHHLGDRSPFRPPHPNGGFGGSDSPRWVQGEALVGSGAKPRWGPGQSPGGVWGKAPVLFPLPLPLGPVPGRH